METQIDKCFAACNDYELCENLTRVIEEYYGYGNLEAQSENIPEKRRLIHFLWGAFSIIEGDGYTAFWAMDCDHIALVKALKLVQMHTLAEVAQESLENIPADKLGDWDALEEYFGGEEKFDKASEVYDNIFITDKPDIKGHLSAYLRLTRYNYVDLVDELETQLTANCIILDG